MTANSFDGAGVGSRLNLSLYDSEGDMNGIWVGFERVTNRIETGGKR